MEKKKTHLLKRKIIANPLAVTGIISGIILLVIILEARDSSTLDINGFNKKYENSNDKEKLELLLKLESKKEVVIPSTFYFFTHTLKLKPSVDEEPFLTYQMVNDKIVFNHEDDYYYYDIANPLNGAAKINLPSGYSVNSKNRSSNYLLLTNNLHKDSFKIITIDSKVSESDFVIDSLRNPGNSFIGTNDFYAIVGKRQNSSPITRSFEKLYFFNVEGLVEDTAIVAKGGYYFSTPSFLKYSVLNFARFGNNFTIVNPDVVKEVSYDTVKSVAEIINYVSEANHFFIEQTNKDSVFFLNTAMESLHKKGLKKEKILDFFKLDTTINFWDGININETVFIFGGRVPQNILCANTGVLYNARKFQISKNAIFLIKENDAGDNFKFKDFTGKEIAVNLEDSIKLSQLVSNESFRILKKASIPGEFFVNLINGKFLCRISYQNVNGVIQLEEKLINTIARFADNEIEIKTEWDPISIIVFSIVFVILNSLFYLALKNAEDKDGRAEWVPKVGGMDSLNHKINYIEASLKDLRRRSQYMLIIGIILGIGGALLSSILFSSQLDKLKGWDDPNTIMKILRPIVLVVFIETFSFFFLKQYRIIFNEYKLFYSMYLRMLNYYNCIEVEESNLPDVIKQQIKTKIIDDKFEMYESNTRAPLNEFENYLNIDKFLEIVKEKMKP